MERIHRAKRLFERNLKQFRCPICHKQMQAVAAGSLICKKNHVFDFSKRGYVNLSGSGSQTVYDKGLFQARKMVFETGIYRPVISVLAEMVLEHGCMTAGKGFMLDAGCGEGYYLREMAKHHSISEQYELCGIDLSRDGIAMAAAGGEKVLWCVADLTNLPVRDQKVKILLNILSPAHYEEFFRVLNKNGIVIKVVPGEEYLREVRQKAHRHLENKAYSNEAVLRYAKNHMKVVEERRVFYQKSITPDIFQNFMRMTPMTSGLSTEEKEQIKADAISEITIDLSIIAGRRKV